MWRVGEKPGGVVMTKGIFDIWLGSEYGPGLVREHKFHQVRRWRFDWAYPDHKIAIEYEGLMSRKSRHTTISGFTADCEKYNSAAQLGWRVYRFTAPMLREGKTVDFIRSILAETQTKKG